MLFDIEHRTVVVTYFRSTGQSEWPHGGRANGMYWFSGPPEKADAYTKWRTKVVHGAWKDDVVNKVVAKTALGDDGGGDDQEMMNVEEAERSDQEMMNVEEVEPSEHSARSEVVSAASPAGGPPPAPSPAKEQQPPPALPPGRQREHENETIMMSPTRAISKTEEQNAANSTISPTGAEKIEELQSRCFNAVTPSSNGSPCNDVPASGESSEGKSSARQNKWSSSWSSSPQNKSMTTGARPDWKPRTWGRVCGINAGLMLLAPNKRHFDTMMTQLQDANHPEHIPGNGPEQDYLSR